MSELELDLGSDPGRDPGLGLGPEPGLRKRTAPGYGHQCLIALARALPSEDVYRRTIMKAVESNSAPSLEEFTSDLDIPALCCVAQHEHTHPIVRLDEFQAKGGDSMMADLYLETQSRYKTEKPVAMFVRLSQPKRLNVVVHRLRSVRTSYDPAVIHSGMFPKTGWIYMERRTDFCRLLASMGIWSHGRPNRIAPIYWGEGGYDDLRTCPPDMLYAFAKVAVRPWKLTRGGSKIFRGLTDEQFIRKVMEMQMVRRIERGDWS